MAVTNDVAQLCRDFVIIAVDEARLHGRDPAEVLQAYRRAMKGNAPLNDLLLAELDRAILDLSETVPA